MKQLLDVMAGNGGVARYEEILGVIGRRVMERLLRERQLVKIWPGIYCLGEPTMTLRLRGLDLRCGQRIAVCLHTAAFLYGFDTEKVSRLHVLNPAGHQLREDRNLAVHRRKGVPLVTVRGRPMSKAAWTAVDVARHLVRERALATLDAALASGKCTVAGLLEACDAQAGMRGITQVRELIPLARAAAESPMESEARLVMHDGGIPEPELQFQITDRRGKTWRVDFAWKAQKVIVEYNGYEFHKSPTDMRRDHERRAALEEAGWRILAITVDDVRRFPERMLARLSAMLAA